MMTLPSHSKAGTYVHDYAKRERRQGGCVHPYELDEPTGYVAWGDWADEKAKTHEQRQCPSCGLWVIYVPKDQVDVVDIRAEVFYRAVCSVCGESPDADGEEYRHTPEEAERIAHDCNWLRVNGRLLCEFCRLGDDE